MILRVLHVEFVALGHGWCIADYYNGGSDVAWESEVRQRCSEEYAEYTLRGTLVYKCCVP
jgi:hypothetical protein